MAVGLQPMGLGDRLSAAFDLYRRNFWTLIAIVAIIVVPYELFSAIVSAQIEIIDPVTDEFNGGATLTLLALIVLGFVADLLATGSATKAIVDNYLGVEPDWQDSIAYGLSRLWPLILGSILFFFGVLIGFIFFIIPGIILAVSWSVWVPAVIVEDKGAASALGRSNELVRGRRWPVFGYILVVALGVGLFSGVVGGVLSGVLDRGADPGEVTVAGTVIAVALALITTPFVVATYVVLYFDQRVRNEPFDVEQLASNMASEPSHSGFGTLQDDTPPEEFGSLDDESPPEFPAPPDA